ncbi:MAG: polyhydroxyalkanoate synthesis regulator DNA-binding domain-containing protein [Deltaproteobacteria bacterium]|nr:polyhydroxyalkanoate synthesis regulator DNA-binding domain-containing protein [Deltaproteobacteria bacterium]MBW2395651.1 polyhydroxyalkanoate synthesis regulator DNA-binding domain-containing protein [Deltaproteobacteria bacterium]
MAVLIKRYANRKLYNTETSRYITLKGIAELLENNQEVKVIDNETREDITSVTLSQILVDTERGGRTVPSNLLQELLQKGGDALYDALRRSADDARENVEELQRGMRRMLGQQGDGEIDANGERRDWIAFSPPDLEAIVQRTLERVVTLLDLPTREDFDAMNARLDKLVEAIEKRDSDEK